MKIDLFQSCGHCSVFQIHWSMECNTLIASPFRILNSSAGIPSPPLALLAAVFPKTNLISHFRMSGSGWVTTSLWLSGSLRCFLHSYSVYACHLFSISSISIRSLPFLSLFVPIFGRNVPLIFPIFLRSLVFPLLLFSSVSLHCPLKKVFLLLLAILWNFAFSWVYLSLSSLLFAPLLSLAICRAYADNYFAFLHLFFLGMALFAASCTTLWASVHSSSGTLFTTSLSHCCRRSCLNLRIFFKFQSVLHSMNRLRKCKWCQN